MFEGKPEPTPPPGLEMAKPFQIKGLRLKNRIIRSSLGGKHGNYDGSPAPAWKHFERRFMRTGVAALISPTVSVSQHRYSPLEYLKIADDRFTQPLREALAHIKEASDTRYILQLGDPGFATQTSLFAQADDALSASPTFDLLYGYSSVAVEMTTEQIAASVRAHAEGARRAKEAGVDAIEVTLSKGYLAHQFLNPATNRRTDAYGGSRAKRFRFASEIVTAVRDAVGPAFPFGVRISTADHNYLPLNLRLPPSLPLRGWVSGNNVDDMIHYATLLERLGVDWLHLSRGFGFPNPKESPGDLPGAEIRRVYSSVSHLGLKARLRSWVVNVIPDLLLRLVLGIGWKKGAELGATGKLAAGFRKAVQIPIIANGGFQSRDLIEATLKGGDCDLVSMARPLLANHDLLAQWHHRDQPERPCTFCNRCSMLTAVVPVGCYDPTRFPDQDAMEDAIMRLTTDPELGLLALQASEPPT